MMDSAILFYVILKQFIMTRFAKRSPLAPQLGQVAGKLSDTLPLEFTRGLKLGLCNWQVVAIATSLWAQSYRESVVWGSKLASNL